MLHSWTFAANGVWEEALSIDARSDMDMNAVEAWIKQSPQNIAFEAIFSLNGVPSTMFGLRLTSLPKMEQLERTLTLLLHAGAIKKEADFQKVAGRIFLNSICFQGI